MQPARIAELLVPFLEPATAPTSCHSEPAHAGEEPAVLPPANDQGLTTIGLERISTYIDLLLRWNARISLTAIRDPEEIVTRHFGESLFAARLLFPGHVGTAAPACPEPAERGRPARQDSAAGTVLESPKDIDQDRGRAALQRRVRGQEEIGALAPVAKTLADLGSGAGFPGLPIKLWAPHISLTLIECSHKKATFLREVVRTLTLTDVNILNARAEEVTASFDVVTLRAVERFDAIVPIAAKLVAPEGRLSLLIGSAQLDRAVADLLMLSWDDPVPVPLSRSRVIAIAYRKPFVLPG